MARLRHALEFNYQRVGAGAGYLSAYPPFGI